MTFKEYILKTAIKNMYDKVILKKDNINLFDLYNKISDKFGYKTVVKKTYNTNKELVIPSSLEMYIKRCQTTLFEKKMRFLEWDKETKSSYYIDNNGIIYATNYKDGLSVKIPSYINERYKNLINFIKLNEIDNQIDIEYILIGHTLKHNYFLGSDNKHYYTESNNYSNFIECSARMDKEFNKFINELNE